MTSESCSSPLTKPTNHPSHSKPVSSSAGDTHAELGHVELRFDKTTDEHSSNRKHSPTNHHHHHSTGGFSLKNPVSSFRTWVANKKSSKDDPPASTMNHSMTAYGKIDTSPTPRKSSLSSDNSKRTRTNSASATTTSSVTNQQQQTNSSSTTRVKKKSSFALRNTNPIALLKRTPETNHHSTDFSSTEQTGSSNSAGASGGGPFGYLKQLVRGDTSSSERKQ